jgi:hypothetical protein
VSAVIGRQDAKVFTEWLETREPIEVGRGGPAVQQNDRRRTGRARDLAHERATTPGKFNVVTCGESVSRSVRAADHVKGMPPRVRQ